MSRSPCVGCSWAPSPALITLEGMRDARKCAAPADQWRITTMSIRIASRFRAVSTSVSPLETDEPTAPMFTVSAASLFSANSKEMRGARGGLEEEVDDRLAPQNRDLLDLPLGHLLEGLRRIENDPDLFGRKGLEARQVLAQGRRRSFHRRSSCESTTASSPSRRGTRTSTRRSVRTGNSRPTISG